MGVASGLFFGKLIGVRVTFLAVGHWSAAVVWAGQDCRSLLARNRLHHGDVVAGLAYDSPTTLDTANRGVDWFFGEWIDWILGLAPQPSFHRHAAQEAEAG